MPNEKETSVKCAAVQIILCGDGHKNVLGLQRFYKEKKGIRLSKQAALGIIVAEGGDYKEYYKEAV